MTDSTYVKPEDRTDSDLLAAGTYWIGDPCYVVRYNWPDSTGAVHDLWGEFLKDAWKDGDANKMKIHDGRVRGARVVASTTAYGDGGYSDQHGNVYSVDAGVVGAVHMDHFFMAGLAAEDFELGTVHTFAEPFRVSFNEETGTISIGHLEIETG